MALAALANGADCGPSNPLQQLTKTWGQDRTLQQDRYNPAASSSKAVFRSARDASVDADAARFFAANGRHAPFDLSPLDRALSPSSINAPPLWAADFAASQASLTPEQLALEHEAFSQAFHARQAGVPDWASAFSNTLAQEHGPQAVHPAAAQHQRHTPSPRHYSPAPYQRHHMVSPLVADPMLAHQAAMQADHVAHAQWEDAFMAQEASTRLLAQAAHEQALHQAHTEVQQPQTDDELARTAGELINSVAHEQNPKFAQSSFLDLMRKLRDHEVAVEGNKVVEQLAPVSATATASVKGKERAAEPPLLRGQGPMDAERFARERQMAANAVEGLAEMEEIWDDEYRQREARAQRGRFQGDGGNIPDEDVDQLMGQQHVPGATSSWEEDFDAADIVGGPPAVQFRPASPARAPSAQQMEWEKLQNDWDQFEATSAGISRVHPSQTASDRLAADYAFRPYNPYLNDMDALGMSNRQHQLHSYPSPLDSVLIKEAEAQLKPHDPKAWYELGVKQQENERENLAISALHKAVEISPGMAEAWLALAVSYTNENDRAKAYDAIERWAGCRFEYAEEVQAYRNTAAETEARRTRTLSERHAGLTDMLIAMARSVGSEADLDADVQIALGVLFNTSEEYEKAGDCFAAAMSVRPEDPLLFNRLGATLANSGRAEEAIRFYFKALELQPAYARARYNLAISCINLSSYKEAAEHLLGALALQEEDAQLAKSLEGAPEVPAAGSITSTVLWDSLHMTMSMLQRSDMMLACEQQDLSAFRDSFDF